MSEIRIDNITYTLKNENACVAQEFLCVEQTADYCVLRVKMSFNAPTVPTPLTVRWLQPMIGFCGQWEPLGKFTPHFFYLCFFLKKKQIFFIKKDTP